MGDLSNEDPDVLLLVVGGFAFYDSDENVVGVAALSHHPSSNSLQFSQSKPLPVADAQRHVSLI
jgi:hypothetical protein